MLSGKFQFMDVQNVNCKKYILNTSGHSFFAENLYCIFIYLCAASLTQYSNRVKQLMYLQTMICLVTQIWNSRCCCKQIPAKRYADGVISYDEFIFSITFAFTEALSLVYTIYRPVYRSVWNLHVDLSYSLLMWLVNFYLLHESILKSKSFFFLS